METNEGMAYWLTIKCKTDEVNEARDYCRAKGYQIVDEYNLKRNIMQYTDDWIIEAKKPWKFELKIDPLLWQTSKKIELKSGKR